MRLTSRRVALGIVAVSAVLAASATAQEILYEVSPEVREATAGQPFRVICDITVSGAEIESLSLPEIGALQLLGQSRSEGTQVTITNGQLASSRTVRLTLTLQADRAGRFTIGPGEVRAGGKVVRSAPVSIEVVAAGAAPAAPPSTPRARERDLLPDDHPGDNDKLFLTLAVDTPEVYLGEQLTVTLTLYSRLDLSDIRNVRMPDFEGVVVQDLVSPSRISPRTVQVGGRRYHAYLLRRVALYPTRAGLLVLPPAEVVAVVGGGFFRSGKLVRRESDPVEVTVKPLPVAGRPKGFEPGNVGRFSLQVGVNRTRISQRDPLTVKVAVIGRGNFRSVAVPSLGEVDGFRVYEPTPFDETRVEEERVQGRKGYEVLLQPQRDGRLTIPALAFSYFDPEVGTYQRVRSDPIPIEVTAWAGAVTSATSEPAAERTALAARPVRLDPGLEGTPRPAWRRFALLVIALHGGGVLLLVVDVAARRRRHSKHRRRRRERDAARRAVLKAAGGGDVGACARAVESYLEVVLGAPVKGLTSEALVDFLIGRGLDEGMAKRIADFFGAAESAQYAPAELRSGRDLAAQARALLRVIERSQIVVPEEGR